MSISISLRTTVSTAIRMIARVCMMTRDVVRLSVIERPNSSAISTDRTSPNTACTSTIASPSSDAGKIATTAKMSCAVRIRMRSERTVTMTRLTTVSKRA